MDRLITDVNKLKTLMQKRKSFPKHKGRLGRVGGSLPKGSAGSVKVQRPPARPNPPIKAVPFEDRVSVMSGKDWHETERNMIAKYGKDWKQDYVWLKHEGIWHVVNRIKKAGAKKEPSDVRDFQFTTNDVQLQQAVKDVFWTTGTRQCNLHGVEPKLKLLPDGTWVLADVPWRNGIAAIGTVTAMTPDGEKGTWELFIVESDGSMQQIHGATKYQLYQEMVPLPPYFQGDFQEATVKQMYAASARPVQEAADRTGLLAGDEGSYYYIQDVLGQHAKSLVDVKDVQNNFQWEKAFYNADPPSYAVGHIWRALSVTVERFLVKGVSGMSNNTMLTTDEKAELERLYAKFPYDALIEGKDWKGDIYKRHPNAYDFSQDERLFINMVAYKANKRAAFLRYVSSIGNTAQENKRIRDVCKQIFEEIKWDDNWSPSQYLNNVVHMPTFEEMGSTMTHSVDSMAVLRKVEPEKRAEVEEIVANTFDHITHTFGHEVNGVYEVKMPATNVRRYDTALNKRDNEKVYMFHGTQYKAAVGIVRTGFKVLPVGKANAGRMLGNGIYLTPISSKAIQYLKGGVTRDEGEGVLLINRAVFGSVTDKYPQSGYDTTEARSSRLGGRHWVKNDEFAVHDAGAVMPQYWVDVTRIARRH